MSNELYNALIITPKDKIEKWSELVSKKIQEGEQVAVFFDTETTGCGSGAIISVIERHGKDEGKLHRIVELGAIVTIENPITGLYDELLDEDGETVRFHEYINPWGEDRNQQKRINNIDEMPYGAYRVHGISKRFLLGQEELGAGLEDNTSNFVLPRPAPIFEEIIDAFMEISGLNHVIKDPIVEKNVKVIAHNIEFDNKFMNSEFNMQNKSEFEAYSSPVCTLMLFRSILPKDFVNKKYNLDNIIKCCRTLPNAEISDIDRSLHGALIDTKLLMEATNNALNSSFAHNSPNKIFCNKSTVRSIDILKDKEGRLAKIKRQLVTLK